jgi:hypothetical protein
VGSAQHSEWRRCRISSRTLVCCRYRYPPACPVVPALSNRSVTQFEGCGSRRIAVFWHAGRCAKFARLPSRRECQAGVPQLCLYGQCCQLSTCPSPLPAPVAACRPRRSPPPQNRTLTSATHAHFCMPQWHLRYATAGAAQARAFSTSTGLREGDPVASGKVSWLHLLTSAVRCW